MAALERMVAAAESDDFGGAPSVADVIEARAAIAKAKGESCES